MRRVFHGGLAASLMVLAGCASQPKNYDYSAFLQAKPASLLVLPPLNNSPEVSATAGVWANATHPLSEAGYYVMPVTLVDETLRGNGVQTAADAHDIPHAKLREVFGADAAVYIKVTRYGTTYMVIGSETRVDVTASIVDLRTGQLLWNGSASASSAEQQQANQGGIVGMLITALLRQVLDTTTDAAFAYSAVANTRLLGAPRDNGVLPGPRSPLYGKPPARN